MSTTTFSSLRAHPMRLLLVGLALLVPTAAPAQSLKEARTAYQRGNYGEAEEDYALHLKNADLVVPASLGLSRALDSQGKDGLPPIESALKSQPKHDELLARKAELLYERDQWESALKTAKAALAAKSDQFLALWIVGQVHRDQGNWAKADDDFSAIVKLYSKLIGEGVEKWDPDTLRVIGLASLEHARYRHLPQEEYDAVFSDIWGDAVKLDKLYWQAEYEMGGVLLEKHSKKDSTKTLDRALATNPRATDVFVIRGQAAFAQMEIKEADIAADEALAINPNHPGALRLKAAVHLFSNVADLALKLLEQARKINPRNEETLGQIAAVRYVQKETKQFDAIEAEVAKFNPKAWRFNAELGEQLGARKMFHESEVFFKKSVDAEPLMPEAQEGLGMLYLRLGKEKEARKVLEDAFDADPFNVRVNNSLKVLDHLKKYQTIETKHYIVKFDPQHDAVLARFVVNYLEDFHDELGKKFDYHPEKPFLIEIFNKHEMFSGRVIALPDLHTIGACTGRMMAMVSTHDKSGVVRKPFNWVRVLRHEVVHLYNLDQTKFQIPHWFTEGLAVTLEGKSTPPSWNYILAEKLRQNDLLNLDNILLGFVRPRTPDHWQQAYLQSQLYVAYMTKTHGEASIGKLLQAYADGLDTDAAATESDRRLEGGVREGIQGVSRGSRQEPADPAGDEAAEPEGAPRGVQEDAERRRHLRPARRDALEDGRHRPGEEVRRRGPRRRGEPSRGRVRQGARPREREAVRPGIGRPDLGRRCPSGVDEAVEAAGETAGRLEEPDDRGRDAREGPEAGAVRAKLAGAVGPGLSADEERRQADGDLRIRGRVRSGRPDFA